MRQLFLLILLLLLPTITTATTPAPLVGEELLDMLRRDQAVRSITIDPAKVAQGQRIAEQMERVDRANSERLQTIVAEHGWPGYQLVGHTAAAAAFLLLQHSPDLDFQERMLPHLRTAFDNGDIEGEWLAQLTDRVRLHRGRKQLYGTQARVENGRVIFQPIEDQQNVDQRRQELGMMPLEQYRRFMEESVGSRSGGELG